MEKVTALQAKINTAEAAKSAAEASTRAEVTHLNEAISKEEKAGMGERSREGIKWCTCSRAPQDKAEGQFIVVAQESVAACKVSKKCIEDRRKYGALTYLIAKQEVWSKVTIKFSSLQLDFLDVPSKSEDEGTKGPKDATDPLDNQNLPPTT